MPMTCLWPVSVTLTVTISAQRFQHDVLIMKPAFPVHGKKGTAFWALIRQQNMEVFSADNPPCKSCWLIHMWPEDGGQHTPTTDPAFCIELQYELDSHGNSQNQRSVLDPQPR
jgi:hypothetical protein